MTELFRATELAEFRQKLRRSNPKGEPDDSDVNKVNLVALFPDWEKGEEGVLMTEPFRVIELVEL